MSNKLEKLNDKHNVFIDEYIKGGGAYKAYLKAYPTSKTSTARSSAAILMSRPIIQQEIAKRKEELRERANIKKEDIVNKLLELIERCESDDDRHHIIKAYDMINKMTGTYQEKIDITSGGEKITGFSIEIIKPK
jgi:phage terminase small subunit